MEYKKYKEYIPETICSVENCNSEADYEVVLYDYYLSYSETFYEQDYTCPFICQKHLEENENKAQGERRPRGYVHYPFTNIIQLKKFTLNFLTLEILKITKNFRLTLTKSMLN
jgi:hypothetical protein